MPDAVKVSAVVLGWGVLAAALTGLHYYCVPGVTAAVFAAAGLSMMYAGLRRRRGG